MKRDSFSKLDLERFAHLIRQGKAIHSIHFNWIKNHILLDVDGKIITIGLAPEDVVLGKRLLTPKNVENMISMIGFLLNKYLLSNISKHLTLSFYADYQQAIEKEIEELEESLTRSESPKRKETVQKIIHLGQWSLALVDFQLDHYFKKGKSTSGEDFSRLQRTKGVMLAKIHALSAALQSSSSSDDWTLI